MTLLYEKESTNLICAIKISIDGLIKLNLKLVYCTRLAIVSIWDNLPWHDSKNEY